MWKQFNSFGTFNGPKNSFWENLKFSTKELRTKHGREMNRKKKKISKIKVIFLKLKEF